MTPNKSMHQQTLKLSQQCIQPACHFSYRSKELLIFCLRIYKQPITLTVPFSRITVLPIFANITINQIRMKMDLDENTRSIFALRRFLRLWFIKLKVFCLLSTHVHKFFVCNFSFSKSQVACNKFQSRYSLIYSRSKWIMEMEYTTSKWIMEMGYTTNTI